jgi:cyclopropane-fatty-acyl-phospholipid synthase
MSDARTSLITFPRSADLLQPGGLMMNHCITSAGTKDTQVDGGMGDFIEKYIFPGGQLVHVGVIFAAIPHTSRNSVRPSFIAVLAWMSSGNPS